MYGKKESQSVDSDKLKLVKKVYSLKKLATKALHKAFHEISDQNGNSQGLAWVNNLDSVAQDGIYKQSCKQTTTPNGKG